MGEVNERAGQFDVAAVRGTREPRLREAREWFSANFHVKSAEDLMRVCLPAARKTRTCAW